MDPRGSKNQLHVMMTRGKTPCGFRWPERQYLSVLCVFPKSQHVPLALRLTCREGIHLWFTGLHLKCCFHFYYIPSAVLSAGDTKMNKQTKVSPDRSKSCTCNSDVTVTSNTKAVIWEQPVHLHLPRTNHKNIPRDQGGGWAFDCHRGAQPPSQAVLSVVWNTAGELKLY